MNNNSIKNIGKLKGKTLVFGGIYSNLQALEALKKIAIKLEINPSNIICTGDVIAYCAQPEACTQLVIDWGIHCIAGNVELQLASGDESCGCNFDAASRCDLFSKNWYPFAQQNISTKSLDWIKKLPEYLAFEYANKQCFVLHGAYQNTSEFIFKSTPWKRKKEQFDLLNIDVILSGHCGLPFHHIEAQKYWLNAGVIGMPANDKQTKVWYLVLDDTKEFDFEHHNYEYDYQQAARLMKANNLPLAYAHTLQTGLWDNCDILPEQETQQQGKPIKKLTNN